MIKNKFEVPLALENVVLDIQRHAKSYRMGSTLIDSISVEQQVDIQRPKVF